jgi:hypothetical protein
MMANAVRQLGVIAQILQNGVPLTTGVSTVGGLPSAATVGQGVRRFVTDANATTFNSVVAGGGSNFLPVFSDALGNWRIG